MPAITGYNGCVRTSGAARIVDDETVILTKLKSFPFFKNLCVRSSMVSMTVRPGVKPFANWDKRTSPQPLHGYAASSCSIGDSGYAAGESIMMVVLPLPKVPKGRAPSNRYGGKLGREWSGSEGQVDGTTSR